MHRAERFIEEVCDYYNVGTEYFANIMLGTTEAVRFLMSKKEKENGHAIAITALKTSQGITFTIQDKSGEPLPETSYDALDQAIEFNNLTREVYIMKSLADNSHFDEHQREIILEFNVTSIRSDRYMGRVSELQEYLSKKPVTTKKSDA